MEKEGERMFLECLDQLEVASAAEVYVIILIYIETRFNTAISLSLFPLLPPPSRVCVLTVITSF